MSKNSKKHDLSKLDEDYIQQKKKARKQFKYLAEDENFVPHRAKVSSLLEQLREEENALLEEANAI